MDFISIYLIPPLQAPVLSTRCSSPQQLLCAGPKPLPGQSVGSLSLVWAHSHQGLCSSWNRRGLCGTEHGCVPWHCFVCEHPGSSRAPSGWEHIPGKSGWVHLQHSIWACFVMSRSQCQETERSMECLQSNIPEMWRAGTHCKKSSGLYMGSSVKWAAGLSPLGICWCSRASPLLLPVFNLTEITKTHPHPLTLAMLGDAAE